MAKDPGKEKWLNEHGELVYCSEKDKNIFVVRSYHWVDRCMTLDESQGRRIIEDSKFSDFEESGFRLMEKEEYDSVRSKFNEIYESQEIWESDKNITEINDMYLDKIIDSLENDYNSWERRWCAGYDQSWVEYHSPKYKNSTGDSISFKIEGNGVEAYINGTINWGLPFLRMLNFFSTKTRRFHRAKSRMKKHLINLEIEERKSKLLKAIK